MPTDFIPASDAGKLAFGANFSTLVTAGPVPLGVTPLIATTLATKQAAYAAALALAVDPGTRGGATILSKDLARNDLVRYIRTVARMIQGNINVTDAQRFALGLTVRDATPSDIPAPGTAPDLDLVSASGRTIRVRLHDSTSSTRRGRPPGVASASLFSYVGATPPATLSGWKFEGNTAKLKPEVVFPATVPAGAVVWLAACWNNAKSQPGPMSSPVGTNLPGGLFGAPEAEAA